MCKADLHVMLPRGLRPRFYAGWHLSSKMGSTSLALGGAAHFACAVALSFDRHLVQFSPPTAVEEPLDVFPIVPRSLA